MERVTGIGGVFQRAGTAASLRAWYAEHLGVDIADWGGTSFEWTPGGSTTWALFENDSDYFGRPDQSFMVNFRVADLDAMTAQLRAAGGVTDHRASRARRFVDISRGRRHRDDRVLSDDRRWNARDDDEGCH